MKKIIQEYGILLIYVLIGISVINLLPLYQNSINSYKGIKLDYSCCGQYNTHTFKITDM